MVNVGWINIEARCRIPEKQATIKIVPLVDNVQLAIEKVLPLLQRSIEANGRNMSMEDVVADMLEGRSLIWGVYMKDTLIAALLQAS